MDFESIWGLYIHKLFLDEPDTLNQVIKKDTTITDVYAIYKETCLDLLARTEELEHSQRDFKILEQVKSYLVLNSIPNW